MHGAALISLSHDRPFTHHLGAGLDALAAALEGARLGLGPQQVEGDGLREA